MGAWNARLWILMRSGIVIENKPIVFFGHLNIDDQHIFPEGRCTIGKWKLKLEKDTLAIPISNQVKALSCKGKTLGSIISLPPCGRDEIDKAANEALVTNVSCNADEITFTYEAKTFAWDEIIGYSA